MQKLRIIIVEDSEDDTMLMLHELQQAGYKSDYIRVQTAGAFKDALHNGPWDLIISDHALPNFSAPEALDILNKSNNDCPFIIVSNAIGEDVAVPAMKAGAHDYIIKNNLTRFIPVIERALQDSEARNDRKKVKQALRESEERFRRLAENAQDLIYRFSLVPERRFEYVSPSARELIGYTPEEHYANPKLICEIVHPEDSDLLKDLFLGKVELSQPLTLRWYHKDGSIIWFEHRNVPIYDEEGILIAIEGIARDITERVLNEQQLKTNHAQIEALSNRILNAMEDERSRLARELHDELGQALTAVKLDIQLLGDQVPATQALNQRLNQTIELVDYTINLVRRQSISLRPPALDDMGLLPAIDEMVRGFMNRTGIDTIVQSSGFSKRLPRPVETALYRCVQESLTNIARHAQAKKAKVSLKRENGLLSISINDDGVGFDPEEQKISAASIGLTGMQERIKLLAGEFTIESSIGHGTTVIIKVPWKNWPREGKKL